MKLGAGVDANVLPKIALKYQRGKRRSPESYGLSEVVIGKGSQHKGCFEGLRRDALLRLT